MFQFQSGTVKSAIRGRLPRRFPEFQFQSGTVKSVTVYETLPPGMLFQFQSGTVKSLLIMLHLCKMCACFNSNLVRLKAFVLDKSPAFVTVSIPIWYG